MTRWAVVSRLVHACTSRICADPNWKGGFSEPPFFCLSKINRSAIELVAIPTQFLGLRGDRPERQSRWRFSAQQRQRWIQRHSGAECDSLGPNQHFVDFFRIQRGAVDLLAGAVGCTVRLAVLCVAAERIAGS
jgi:hypothetical protein